MKRDIINMIDDILDVYNNTPRNNKVKQYLNINGETLINDFDDSECWSVSKTDAPLDSPKIKKHGVLKEHKILVPDKYGIKKVIINKPAVIIIWADGTKTMAKCEKGDRWDAEKGFAIALAKHYVGNGAFNDMLSRYVWDMEN